MRTKAGKNLRTVFALALAFCLFTGLWTKVAQAAGQNLDQKAEQIVKAQVSSKDSAKKKLKKLFTYVQKEYDYARKTGFEAYDGWEEDYALEMFADKKGSCYHYAAAYAVLAKKATGYSVRIGLGQTNGFSGSLQKHAWTEVKIRGKWYICDPNMDKYAKDCSGAYCLKKRNGLKNTYDKFKNVKYVNV